MDTGFKRYHIPLYCLLLPQYPKFPLCPPHAKGSGGVLAVEGLPWYEHVTVVAAGVGTVSLLRNKYHFPNVAVDKVNTEVGSTCRPHPSALDWSCH